MYQYVRPINVFLKKNSCSHTHRFVSHKLKKKTFENISTSMVTEYYMILN